MKRLLEKILGNIRKKKSSYCVVSSARLWPRIAEPYRVMRYNFQPFLPVVVVSTTQGDFSNHEFVHFVENKIFPLFLI